MKPSSRKPASRSRGRTGRNQIITKNGNVIKLNNSVGDRMKARKDARSRKKAAYLSTLPKGKIQRTLARLHPKRVAKYWFSREGAIMSLKLVGIGTVAGFLMLVGLFAYFRKDLPNLKDISGTNIGGSSRYYDRTGQVLLWEDYNAVKRIPVKDADIPQYVKDATVAVEDKDFFKHGGFDVRGITRAGVNNLKGSGSQQGGSTITQQLVKLTQNWTNDRSYTRKVKELILSVEVERSYSKKEILTGYLNTAPYGNIQYGVESASQDYFQKPAKQLTLDESAFLAAIPQSPSLYSPYGSSYQKDPVDAQAALVKRQRHILDLMVQQGMITKAVATEAKKVDTVAKVHEPNAKYANMQAPYFVLAAKAALEEKYPTSAQKGGWKITTTLDMNLQRSAEEQVQKGLVQVRRQGGDTAAFVAEDVTNGQIVALLGGADFNNKEAAGEVNFARQALPPGSSFKPYDYIALMENTTNVGGGSVLYDQKGPLPGYPCTRPNLPKTNERSDCLYDYDSNSPGALTIRYSLGGSRNIPAAKAMATVGVNKPAEVAEKLGLKSGYKCYKDNIEEISQATKDDEKPCGLSSSIGDGAYLHLDEHVHAYASISRNGLNIPETYILKITDSQSKTIDEWKPSKGTQAIRPDSAYIMADMLSDPNASYFPRGNKPQVYNGPQGAWKFGLKTGTTNDSKDGWLMGFSTKYAAGVWVGNHTNQVSMNSVPGMEAMTRPIWQGWMRAAHESLKPTERSRPAGIQTLPAYVVRKAATGGEIVPSQQTDIYPSWFKQPTKKDGASVIDQVSNKLATTCTPERAKRQVNNANANIFSVDIFVNGGGAAANTTATDDLHKCDDAKPSITLTATNCTVVATTSQGTHPINSAGFPGTVNFLVNGQIAKSANVADSPASVSFTAPGGTTAVTAQVIDSVLYDASDNVNLDCGGSSTGSPLTLSGVADGGLTQFTWDGNSGITGAYRAADDSVICTGTTGGCSTASALAPAGTQVYAKDNVGQRSSTVTISGS